MRKYYTKTDWFYRLTAALVFAVSVIVVGLELYEGANWSGILTSFFLFFGTLTLFYLIPRSTYYKIEVDHLFLHTLWIGRKIPFNEIKSVKRDKSWHHSTLKFSASVSGLSIRYNKYEEVFISPKEEADFLRELIEKNPHCSLNNSI